MSDLLSLDRAKLQIPAATSSDDPLIAALVSACSEVVEQYCRRRFAKATYDELVSGGGGGYLYIANPPISSVIRIRSGLLAALYVQFRDPANLTQEANVSVSSTGVTITSITNNTTATNTFAYATYPTITALAAQINGVSGWTATVSGQFAQWQASELAYIPGAFSARNISVPLNVFWWGLPSYQFDAERGEIYAPAGWQRGYRNYRVTYIGGYSEIPESIQQAVAELVQLSYATLKANPLMQSESLDRYAYQRAATTSFDLLSLTAKQALSQHRIYDVAKWH